MIRRILCPTDLTVHSKDGVTYAFSLAQRNGAQLIVFHTTSFPTLWQYPCELDSFYRWEEMVSKFKMDRLLAAAERRVRGFVCEKFGIESDAVAWKPKIALGRVADEIVTAALQEDVDLIVLNRRQRALLPRFLARGILEQVSRNAPCPVLSLDATKPIYPFAGWRMPMVEEVVHSY
jgi:universal stress protein A